VTARSLSRAAVGYLVNAKATVSKVRDEALEMILN
jgi:hypothetical protein